MPGFVTEPAELLTAADCLRAVADELCGSLARLDADVEALLGGWRGPAGRSFASEWQPWYAGARQVIAAVASMADLLAHTGQVYAAAEHASTFGASAR
jgi:WXG100 family type VII secretion target